MPTALVSIENDAFKDAGFTCVYLGDKVQSIGARAFMNCGELMEAHIPDSVTSIGEDAFSGCPNLVLITNNPVAIRYANSNGLTVQTH